MYIDKWWNHYIGGTDDTWMLGIYFAQIQNPISLQTILDDLHLWEALNSESAADADGYFVISTEPYHDAHFDMEIDVITDLSAIVLECETNGSVDLSDLFKIEAQRVEIITDDHPQALKALVDGLYNFIRSPKSYGIHDFMSDDALAELVSACKEIHAELGRFLGMSQNLPEQIQRLTDDGQFDEIVALAQANDPYQNFLHVTLNLNARLQPFHRYEIFEDPVAGALEKQGIGCVDGGGTLLETTGEIRECDVEIFLYEKSAEHFTRLRDILAPFGVPKGSFLVFENEQGEFERHEIGDAEGLALYLNGTDLEDEVYKTCDSNYVISEVVRLLGGEYTYYSYWQGPEETALYFYGNSFENMNTLITPFIEEYPLCRKCRVVQIA
jgi:hypothetical protein